MDGAKERVKKKQMGGGSRNVAGEIKCLRVGRDDAVSQPVIHIENIEDLSTLGRQEISSVNSRPSLGYGVVRGRGKLCNFVPTPGRLQFFFSR